MSAQLEQDIYPDAPELSQERPARGAYTDYSIQFKAEALALVNANGGNILRTANELNIPEQSLRNWILVSDRFHQVREQKELDLASKFESNAHLLVNSISEHDLSTASLSQKATAAGIMVDKMQLLRSQPTSIVQNVNIESLTITLQQVIAEITSSDSTD